MNTIEMIRALSIIIYPHIAAEPRALQAWKEWMQISEDQVYHNNRLAEEICQVITNHCSQVYESKIGRSTVERHRTPAVRNFNVIDGGKDAGSFDGSNTSR